MRLRPRLYEAGVYKLNNYTKTFVVLCSTDRLLYSIDDVADTRSTEGAEAGRTRRLAALRLSRLKSDREAADRSGVVAKAFNAPMVLPGSRRRRAARAGARDRTSQPGHASGRQATVCGTRTARGGFENAAAGHEAGRNGIFAGQRDSLCVPRRCRYSRGGEGVGSGRGVLRGSHPAL